MIAWCLYFLGIAAATLFGFYAMAHPSRSLWAEVCAFGLTLLAGAMVGAGICALEGDDVEIIPIICFTVGAATLMAAAPRLVYQSFHDSNLSLGFLFRLSAYCALLLAIERSGGGPVNAWVLAGAMATCTVAFLMLLGVSRRGPGWALFVLMPVVVYLNNLAFYVVINWALDRDIDEFWEAVIWDGLSGDTGRGLIVFHVVTVGFSKAVWVAERRSLTPQSPGQDPPRIDSASGKSPVT